MAAIHPDASQSSETVPCDSLIRNKGNTVSMKLHLLKNRSQKAVHDFLSSWEGISIGGWSQQGLSWLQFSSIVSFFTWETEPSVPGISA